MHCCPLSLPTGCRVEKHEALGTLGDREIIGEMSGKSLSGVGGNDRRDEIEKHGKEGGYLYISNTLVSCNGSKDSTKLG